MRVVVTGSSACLARSLLPALCADPRIEAVTGVDRAPPCFSHPRFRAVQRDIRDPAVPPLLRGHDALVHLAFVVLRGRTSEEEMLDVNVRASHLLFLQASAAGIRRLIHVSSAAVYGRGAGLTEAAPLAPLEGFAYARHKVELERRLAADFPECLRLRPHVILGPNAQPLLRQLLAIPGYPALPEPQPRLQCVHEDDVAEAVRLALRAGAAGAFNLATADSFSYRDAIRRRHRVSLPLPLAAARAALRLACRRWGWGGEPAWIEGLAQTLVLDCSRAAVELGWRSRYSAAEVLAAT